MDHVSLFEVFLSRLLPILNAAFGLVHDCSCEEGCPSCVGPRDPQEEIDGNPKAGVVTFLHKWIEDLRAEAQDER